MKGEKGNCATSFEEWLLEEPPYLFTAFDQYPSGFQRAADVQSAQLYAMLACRLVPNSSHSRLYSTLQLASTRTALITAKLDLPDLGGRPVIFWSILDAPAEQ